jgi:predicted aspartyl protease
VKGRIGPLDAVNILLDTGTTRTMVSKDIAERLRLAGKPGLLLTLNGVVTTQSVIVPYMQIGALSANSVLAVIEDLSFFKLKPGMPIDAVAGFDVLGATSFTIDYRAKKIVLGALATRKSVRFETSGPLLVVKARIEDDLVRLLLDSGASGLLVFRNRLQLNWDQHNTNGDAMITTAAGVRHSPWFLASRVSLGDRDLGRRAVVLARGEAPANDFDGLFGFSSMGFNKVSFDFKKGLFAWE